MLTRLLLSLAVASTALACTTAADSADSASAAATTGDGGDGHSADGTWDISVVGPDSVTAASEMTVNGGQIDGTIIYPDEGTQVDEFCTLLKNRLTFSFTVTGDTLTGSITQVVEYSNNTWCGSGPNVPEILTARRTPAAANADGQTALEGSWVWFGGDGVQSPYEFAVSGLLAQIWSTPQHTDEVFGVSLENGVARTTNTNDDHLTFAARKR